MQNSAIFFEQPPRPGTAGFPAGTPTDDLCRSHTPKSLYITVQIRASCGTCHGSDDPTWRTRNPTTTVADGEFRSPKTALPFIPA